MDAQYFINKFEAIPEEKWTVDTHIDNQGRRCAWGHLLPVDMTEATWGGRIGGWSTPEGKVLANIIGGDKLAGINNGTDKRYQQETPKQRVLAALRDIQLAEQQDKAVEEVKEVLAQEPELV